MAAWYNLLDQLDMDNHVAAVDPHPVYQLVDADLTAIAALTGTGHAQRTGLNTWALTDNPKWGVAKRGTDAGETLIIPVGYGAIYPGDFTNSGDINNSGNRMVI